VVNLSILNPSNKSMVVGSVFAIEVEVELKSSATSNKINDLILFLVDEGTEELLPLDSSVSVGKLEVGEKRTVHVRFQGLRVGVVKIPEIQAFSKIEKVRKSESVSLGATSPSKINLTHYPHPFCGSLHSPGILLQQRRRRGRGGTRSSNHREGMKTRWYFHATTQ
jgi:hypothetical protein